ncbi:CatB-related O-acetyltransferase [Leeuwenhoekiella parthenopeia]|uniref:CatB-related O-acetyltransferase n=1 Tax=Leeuwenhoekiella parthenopeia TaxID=2890320 RepID=A0ABS8GW47_9FLAO|nr:CatB-related O-acetyltransferase [Leeuwenhoekiella parthenopeia]MCC4214250.1 CatB-related O-acetyltransferase [Leeuwenhoekiella parthenopeia]
MLKLIKRYFFFIIKYRHFKKQNVRLDASVKCYNTSFAGHNRILPRSNVSNSKIGIYSYTGEDCKLINVKIGNFSSIGPKVEVIYGTHPIDFVSTSPVFYSTRKQTGSSFVNQNKFEEFKLRDKWSCIIGNDVWVGFGVKIVEGIKIGDGAIILAGAYVTKDVMPYSIVGGVPAKHIKSRFSETDITFLSNLKWWDWPKDTIYAKRALFLDLMHFKNEFGKNDK